MPPDYAGIVLMVGLAVVAAVVVAAAQRRLGPGGRGAPTAVQPAASEQGSELRGRAAVRFHLVALLFVLLAAESALLLLWAVSFRQLGVSGLFALTAFVLPLAVGFVYEWAKGALEW